MGQSRQAVYYGWLGYRNLGDEAIYVANQRLFPDWQLTDSKSGVEGDVTLVGGGTILPAVLKRGTEWTMRRRELNVGIGLGVRDPAFWNARRPGFDVRHHLANVGVDLPALLKRGPKPVRYLTSGLSDAVEWLPDPEADYFFDRDYARIGTFGFDSLTVRGPRSREILAGYDIDAEVVGDTALTLEPSSYDHDRTARVGVVLRGPRPPESYATSRAYVEAVVGLCREYASTYEFVFLPFEPRDVALNQWATRQVPNARFRDYTSVPDVDGLVEEIATCEYLIGEKLHGVVLAAASHVPFVCVAYAPKHADFVESVGMEEYTVRADRLTQDGLRSVFESLREDDEVTSALEERVSTLRARLRATARDVARDSTRTEKRP